MSDKHTSEEIAQLRQLLEEANETLRAIRSGEVDALVVNTKLGERVFTLQGADTVYRIAIENVNEGVITLSSEGTILYANHYFAQMMRANLDKIIGASVFDFVTQEVRNTLATLLEHDGRGEVALRSGDGAQVPTYIATKKIHLDDLISVCAVVTDLTLQKRSEEMLATRNLVQSIIEQSPNAVMVCDAAGTVLHATQAAQRLPGCPALGHSIETVLSNICFSDKPLKFADFQNGSIESGTIVSCQSNGETLAFLLRYSRIAQDGGVRGYVISLADITQLKKAEEALRESEEKYRSIFDSNMVGIAFWLSDGRLTEANQAFCDLLGCTVEEVRTGQVKWTDCTPPELLPRDQQGIDEINVKGFCTPYHC